MLFAPFSALFSLLLLSAINPTLSAPCPPGSVYISLQGNAWSCFAFVTNLSEFFNAELDCQNQGGFLASIHNIFEDIFISESANTAFGASNNKFWIGITKLAGNWTYNDSGQLVAFFEWAPGQPAMAGDEEGCVSVDTHGYWYSDDCFDEKFYVCEVPSTDAQHSTPPSSSSRPPPTIDYTTAAKPSSTAAQTTTDFTRVSPCSSYIPFCYDVSTSLTASEFAAMKATIVDPFLNQLFPLNLQPADFCTYDMGFHGIPRQSNVTDLVAYLAASEQGMQTSSRFIKALELLLDLNVLNYPGGLPVNTVIFAGTSLARADVEIAQNLTTTLTANANTVNVVLASPTVDQSNYRLVKNLTIVSWGNPIDVIYHLETNLNCQNNEKNKS